MKTKCFKNFESDVCFGEFCFLASYKTVYWESSANRR